MKWLVRFQWFVILVLSLVVMYTVMKWLFFAVISLFVMYLAVRIMLASKRKAKQ